MHSVYHKLKLLKSVAAMAAMVPTALDVGNYQGHQMKALNISNESLFCEL